MDDNKKNRKSLIKSSSFSSCILFFNIESKIFVFVNLILTHNWRNAN